MGGVLLAIAYRSRPNGTARIFLFNLAVLQPRIFICTKNREMVQCSANWIIIVAATLINVTSYLLICNKMIVNGILMDYVTTLGGFAIFVFMYRLFKVRTPKKLLCGISTLSYELYLIHHPFCLGEISFFNLFPALNDWAVVVLVITISTISAYILKHLSGSIYNVVTVKFLNHKN